MTTAEQLTGPADGHAPIARTVRLSAVVLTHPDRISFAEAMCERYPELDLSIVVDPAPGAGPDALQRAYRLAWAAVPAHATHHLVVEDDTILCHSFRDHLERALAARPDHPVTLYTEWGSETSNAVRLAAMVGSPWAECTDDYVSTQALVLPARLARGFGASELLGGPLYDFDMRLFLASVGIPAYVTVPNLAEDARLPSVTGHGFLGERASACFLESGPSAVDWTTEVSEPSTVPAMSFGTAEAYAVRRPHRAGQRWRRMPHPVVPRSGLSAAAMLHSARAAIEREPAAVRVIGPRLLHALWQTGYGLGLVAADVLGSDGVEVERVLARPLVRRALATMPHGALRCLVDDEHRAEQHSTLIRMVQVAVRQGFQANRNS